MTDTQSYYAIDDAWHSFIVLVNQNDDDYSRANEDENEEDDADEDDFYSISKPKSWCECIIMMFTQNEDRLLMIQN